MGGSAGSTKALRQIVALLPPDLPAGVLVATHMSPHAPNDRLAKYLDGAGSLPAAATVDGERIRPGRLRTSVPDRHLVISDHDVLRLSRGPRENQARPAVDALFRSAARWCGSRVIGVVLSGSLDDGAAGLAAIAECGGQVLVQHPDDARFDSMPRAALRAVPDAVVLPAVELPRAIAELAGDTVAAAAAPPSDALIWETEMIEGARPTAIAPGRPIGLGCPECGGGMNVIETGKAVHYVCHSGHSYSPEAFIAARDANVEVALWTALSALEEQSVVLQDMAAQADRAGDRDTSHRHLSSVRRIGDASKVLRAQLYDAQKPPPHDS